MPIDVLTLHWSLHPDKDEAWYEREKTRRTEDEIAVELDIKYVVSQGVIVFGKSFKKQTNLEANLFKNYVKKDKSIIRVWDFGQYPCVLYAQNRDGVLYIFGEYVPLDRPNTTTLVKRILEHDRKKFSGFSFVNICDIAGKRATNTIPEEREHKSDIDLMRQFKDVDGSRLNPRYNYVPVNASIELIHDMFLSRQIVIDPRCIQLVLTIESGYCWDRKEGEEKEAKPKQVHPYEDIADCLRYLVWEYYRPRRSIKKSQRTYQKKVMGRNGKRNFIY